MKALLEVVQSASKSMEVAVMERGKPLEVSMEKSQHVLKEVLDSPLVHILHVLHFKVWLPNS